jgi:NitT/TauT family transport system substrate-binding protein
MRNVKRWDMLAGSLALVAAPAVARAQTLTTLRVGLTADEDVVGLLYAQQAGLFRKAGVEIAVTRLNGSAEITAALVGGSLDVGKVSTYNIILAHSKGIPLVIEAPAAIYTRTTNGTGDVALVAAKSSTISKGADLNGKTMATNSIGDYLSLATMGWVDQTGGDSKTLRFVEVPRSAVAAAILSGRVDVGILAQPNLNAALAGGCKVVGFPLDVFGKQYVATAFVTTPTFAAANGATLARFRRALSDGSAYANTHQSVVLPLLASFTNDPSQLSGLVNVVVGTQSRLHDPSMFQSMIDAALKYKTIPAGFRYTEMIDPAALAG